jgi:hypothetical protein
MTFNVHIINTLWPESVGNWLPSRGSGGSGELTLYIAGLLKHSVLSMLSTAAMADKSQEGDRSVLLPLVCGS